MSAAISEAIINMHVSFADSYQKAKRVLASFGLSEKAIQVLCEDEGAIQRLISHLSPTPLLMPARESPPLVQQPLPMPVQTTLPGFEIPEQRYRRRESSYTLRKLILKIVGDCGLSFSNIMKGVKGYLPDSKDSDVYLKGVLNRMSNRYAELEPVLGYKEHWRRKGSQLTQDLILQVLKPETPIRTDRIASRVCRPSAEVRQYLRLLETQGLIHSKRNGNHFFWCSIQKDSSPRSAPQEDSGNAQNAEVPN